MPNKSARKKMPPKPVAKAKPTPKPLSTYSSSVFGDPTSTQVIHGKPVDVGTGVGERAGKKAKSAIELRKERQKKALEGIFNG